MISVIIPTISSRSDMFEDTREKYLRSYNDIEVIRVLDFPTWASGCNEGFKYAKGDIIHYTADDLNPLDGWAEAVIQTLSNNDIPAPYLWNYRFGGRAWNWEDGNPGDIPPFSRVPTLTRKMADDIGTWPESLHYFADNWISDKGRLLGYETRLHSNYRFVHHWNPNGRLDRDPNWWEHWKAIYNVEREKIGLPPV